jgi:hypothetical protein
MQTPINNSSGTIVVFTSDFFVGAFVDFRNDSVQADVHDTKLTTPIDIVLETFKTTKASLPFAQEDNVGNHIIGFEEIDKHDPRYYSAVIEGFRRSGLTAVYLPKDLAEQLKRVLEKTSEDKREVIVRELLSMNPAEFEQFQADLQEAYTALINVQKE